jgi:hypothetical protein
MFDLITVTKTRYFVTCCIAFIFICIAFSSDDSDLSFFGILLGMIAAGVAIFYFIDNSCRCHHCGAWNSAKEVKCLSRETYKSLDNVKVKNKIYNNKNEEIGYIEDNRKELRNHTVRRVLYKCSNCGIEWEKVEHY